MKAEDLFKGWDETIIWSCLQQVMGKIYMDGSESAAVAMLGDFAFYAGKPSEELVSLRLEGRERDFMIMVPQNGEWAAMIEKCHKGRAKRVLRYATKKERNIFDTDKLKQAVMGLPDGYELRLIGESEYNLCKGSSWACDLVSQFKDYNTYKRLGLGVAAYHGKQLVSGASSYSRYNDGIEIEIDTECSHRRKGLAYACGAKLILECMERGLYPSWDAQNMWSLALAKKLGYHFDHAYLAYEITGYQEP